MPAAWGDSDHRSRLASTLPDVLVLIGRVEHPHQLVILLCAVAVAAQRTRGVRRVIVHVAGQPGTARAAERLAFGRLKAPHATDDGVRSCHLAWHGSPVSTLRSVAFGASVLLTMVLLLLANLGVWAIAGLLDQGALARVTAHAVEDPVVRRYISRQVGTSVAVAILDQGPLPGPVRQALALPARPTEARLGEVLGDRIEGLLADGAEGDAVLFASAAFAQLATAVLEGRIDPASEGLEVDLSPIGRLVLDRIDPTGTLAGVVAPGSASIRLLEGPLVGLLVALVRLLDTLRVLLPIGCVVAIALTLALARYRVHALAWVGLGGVVAGTVSLLIASGGPVLVSRTTAAVSDQTAAITAALDAVTSGLVVQSAALAALGLALVVAGIAGGVVVSRDDSGRRDLRHGWDPGGLS